MLNSGENTMIMKSCFDKNIDVPIASIVKSGWLTFNNCAIEEFDLKNKIFYSLSYQDNKLYFTFSNIVRTNYKKSLIREDTRAYFNIISFLKNNNVVFPEKSYFKIYPDTKNKCFIDLTKQVTEQTINLPEVGDTQPDKLEIENTGDFELFTKEFRSSSINRENLCVSITKDGRISFNYNMVNQFNLAVNIYVRLFYDEKGKRVGFKFTSNKLELGARKMLTHKNNIHYGTVVNSRQFFRKYNNFGLTETKTYILETDEKTGIHFIQL